MKNDLKWLGVSSEKRSASLPELPTIAEAGVPDYEYSGFHGVFAPAGTPPAVVQLLTEKVKAALAHYEPALAQFRARDFAGARERFQQALAVRPDDGPSKTYVERCTYFLEHPPEAGWDGVWHMKEK